MTALKRFCLKIKYIWLAKKASKKLATCLQVYERNENHIRELKALISEDKKYSDIYPKTNFYVIE